MAAAVLSTGIESEDPVTMFLRRQAETYGLGYYPSEYGGKTAPEKLEDQRTKLIAIIRELFGPSWRVFLGHVGFPEKTAEYICGFDTRPKKNRKSDLAFPHHLRLAQMVLLTHISGIRETLNDLEREIWVLMQQSHDPELTGESAYHHRMAQTAKSRQSIREALGKVLIDIPKPYFLPIRSLAMLNYPNLTSREATRLEILDRLERDALGKKWLSQGEYDGMRDPDVVVPDYLHYGSKVGRGGWYAHFRMRERALHPRRKVPPARIDAFPPDMLERYHAAKAANQALKALGRGRTPRKPPERDLGKYMRQSYEHRNREKRAFLEVLEKHGVDIKSAMDNFFSEREQEAAHLDSTDEDRDGRVWHKNPRAKKLGGVKKRYRTVRERKEYRDAELQRMQMVEEIQATIAPNGIHNWTDPVALRDRVDKHIQLKTARKEAQKKE